MLLAAFAVCLRLAQTRAVNSDGAAQALQAWDMLHGNPLLRGWTTPARVFSVGEYTIWYWPKNLLSRLARLRG